MRENALVYHARLEGRKIDFAGIFQGDFLETTELFALVRLERCQERIHVFGLQAELTQLGRHADANEERLQLVDGQPLPHLPLLRRFHR